MDKILEFLERHPTWKLEFWSFSGWLQVQITLCDVQINGDDLRVDDCCQPCHLEKTLVDLEEKCDSLSKIWKGKKGKGDDRSQAMMERQKR